jgi:hypothetical protein
MRGRITEGRGIRATAGSAWKSASSGCLVSRCLPASYSACAAAERRPNSDTATAQT